MGMKGGPIAQFVGLAAALPVKLIDTWFLWARGVGCEATVLIVHEPGAAGGTGAAGPPRNAPVALWERP